MCRLLFLTALFVFPFWCQAQFQGLLVNEFSQGDQGSREYIELLVLGKRTCTDSTADLRGWIFDDQNGWYGTTSNAPGHYRFKDVASWSKVPIGSIILFYNPADKNRSIAAADDPEDSNHDYTYIVPINAGNYLEENNTEPTGGSGTGYVYPAASTTTGYGPSTDAWVSHIALNTGGDVITTVSPSDRSNPFFSIGYGFASFPPYRVPTVSVPAVAGGNNCYLIDSFYIAANSWAIAAVPASETPGQPNGGENTAWILRMRESPKAQSFYITACNTIPALFQNQGITATGLYTAYESIAGQCPDTTHAYIVITKKNTLDTVGCSQITYQGVNYTSDTSFVRNIKSSVVTDCDSITTTVNIVVKQAAVTDTSACILQNGSFTLYGQTFSIPGDYEVHKIPAQDCDSVFRLHLNVTKLEQLDTSACETVPYNGTDYRADTSFVQQIAGRNGCDSIQRTVKITVKHKTASFNTACIGLNASYNFNGQNLSASGLYTATLLNAQGCDSTVTLYMVKQKEDSSVVSGCGQVVFRGVTYTSPAVVKDTIKSLVTGCDSIFQTVQIVLRQPQETSMTACIPEGSSYDFNGQQLTATGQYTTTYAVSANCDSTVHLYLVVSKVLSQTITDCGEVVYKGIPYTSSTTITDTIKSTITQCDSVLNQVNIVVNQKPVINLPANKAICLGDDITLTATASNAEVTWVGYGTDNIVVSPTTATTYTVTATDGFGCSSSDSVRITVDDFTFSLSTTTPTAMAGTQLIARTSANLPYTILSWQPSSLFTNQTATTQTFTADSSLTIAAIAASPSGCIDTAYVSFVITPLSDVYIPSGFTPNGDGKNDVLRVRGGNITELDFKVFNRWGQLVFAGTDKNRGWDGNYAGQRQPIDTYVYVVKIKLSNGQVIQKKGTVNLLR